MSKTHKKSRKAKNTQKSTLVIKKIVFSHKIDQKFLLNFMCISVFTHLKIKYFLNEYQQISTKLCVKAFNLCV